MEERAAPTSMTLERFTLCESREGKGVSALNKAMHRQISQM